MSEDFNPNDYICKFYFLKYDYAKTSNYRQKVSANLYLNELTIEIIDSSNKTIAIYGYPLKNKIKQLLPLIKWEEFEKTRDVSGCDLTINGYRDGWGYQFLCMNESGKPLIRNNLDVTFSETDKPAYERLLDWVIHEYAKKKVLKNYKLIW